jgi:hypothetical protein
VDQFDDEWHDPTSLHIIPHSAVGDADCCGCIFPLVREDHADLMCNEYEAILRSVPKAEIDRALDDLAAKAANGQICSHTCPICGTLNAFPGFSAIFAYVYSARGEGIGPPGAFSDSNVWPIRH